MASLPNIDLHAVLDLDVSRASSALGRIKSTLTSMFSTDRVIRTASNSIREIVSDITNLDTVMNDISIVTNMTTADLWDQMSTYKNLAQSYGVTVQGAYEVSKIFYQQGKVILYSVL